MRKSKYQPRLLTPVLKVIAEMEEKRGSTFKSILTSIQNDSNIQPKPRNVVVQVKAALKHGVINGVIRNKAGRFQLTLDSKKLDSNPKPITLERAICESKTYHPSVIVKRKKVPERRTKVKRNYDERLPLHQSYYKTKAKPKRRSMPKKREKIRRRQLTPANYRYRQMDDEDKPTPEIAVNDPHNGKSNEGDLKNAEPLHVVEKKFEEAFEDRGCGCGNPDCLCNVKQEPDEENNNDNDNQNPSQGGNQDYDYYGYNNF